MRIILKQEALKNVEEWQEYKEIQYSETHGWATNADKKKEEFRNFKKNPRYERVRNFYCINHTNQTYDFVLKMKKKYQNLGKMEMGVWEALEMLDKFVDDSDPDTNLSQMQHALQTAEAIRKEYPGEKYDWYHLVGLIHDMGKFLSCVYGEEQWTVVGDTFPVGCKFSDKIEFHEFFIRNPDSKEPKFQSKFGVYTKGCGLDKVHLSYGHDEYLYQVCIQNKSTLPLQALYMIRYHSFYPWHKEGQYMELCNKTDLEMLKWVKDFNQFDLYSKAHEEPNVKELSKYYKNVVRKYFPEKLKW
mmetsp:Transcript_4650/g.6582  ORF Transcript_4650/g.6582 Transcript_4650/m.6582 type:complete len:301 (-) Transcript_4650:218-1120(-)|eukprot:CAMPEP_0184481612 /NCGR_PEP_ID=MMETSP0113_2-20130426/3169_1 /TAXON_ID=91329 /ORGANISM="Norrisiella sphaerica, Strain BC52" /LENGTH=300 /DNA_ID=CAMNT_0026860831 /DNA_START=29 /DNA_END=928 /DNA_ORIENTATION=+